MVARSSKQQLRYSDKKHKVKVIFDGVSEQDARGEKGENSEVNGQHHGKDRWTSGMADFPKNRTA